MLLIKFQSLFKKFMIFLYGCEKTRLVSHDLFSISLIVSWNETRWNQYRPISEWMSPRNKSVFWLHENLFNSIFIHFCTWHRGRTHTLTDFYYLCTHNFFHLCSGIFHIKAILFYNLAQINDQRPNNDDARHYRILDFPLNSFPLMSIPFVNVAHILL